MLRFVPSLRRLRPAAAAAAGLLLLAAWLVVPAAGREPSRERLLGNLLRAEGDHRIEAALDELAEKGGFADPGAFADYLGRVAEPTGSHPRVRLRRGWAYVTAGRGAEAVRPLELARESPSVATVATAYLGEALRQAGEPVRGLERLAEAAAAGYEETAFLDEAAHKAGFDLRSRDSARDATWLPTYVAPMEAYLAVREVATLHAALARWLLDDHRAFGGKGGGRIAAWSDAAARHALAAVRAEPGIAGALRLALDASRALRWDRGSGALHPLAFDCAAWAYRLGRGPDLDTHEAPQAIAWLAEAALAEGRFRLAARLARERLEISDSPLAREVLQDLPLDLGD